MNKNSNNFFEINGTASAVGYSLGRASSRVLAKRIQETRRIQKRQGISDSIICARIKDFTRLLNKTCPAWLCEAGGMAKGAGIAVDDILMLNCLPPNFFPTTLHCTTFVTVGEKQNQLLKIRDERNDVQSFHSQAINGAPRLQIGRDIGNLGAAHIMTQHGLAGGNNTGSETSRIADNVRLNDCHILRYLAENASSVEEIPKVFERILDANAVGGAAADRGSIYVFVDPQAAIQLESVSDEVEFTPIKTGTHVISNHFLTSKAQSWGKSPAEKNSLLRKKRMEEILVREDKTPEPAAVFAMSRDRRYLPHALCNDDKKHFWMTISSQLHVIPRSSPCEAVSYICCGNTRHSFYVPVRLDETRSFGPFINGSFYQACDKLYRTHGCNAHLRPLQHRFERWAMDISSMAETAPMAFALLKSEKLRSEWRAKRRLV